MKGTGRWTIQEAAERNVPATTIAAALDARYLRWVWVRLQAGGQSVSHWWPWWPVDAPSAPVH